MASNDLLNAMIARLGASQAERADSGRRRC